MDDLLSTSLSLKCVGSDGTFAELTLNLAVGPEVLHEKIKHTNKDKRFK